MTTKVTTKAKTPLAAVDFTGAVLPVPSGTEMTKEYRAKVARFLYTKKEVEDAMSEFSRTIDAAIAEVEDEPIEMDAEVKEDIDPEDVPRISIKQAKMDLGML